jgi:hypothetical protein
LLPSRCRRVSEAIKFLTAQSSIHRASTYSKYNPASRVLFTKIIESVLCTGIRTSLARLPASVDTYEGPCMHISCKVEKKSFSQRPACAAIKLLHDGVTTLARVASSRANESHVSSSRMPSGCIRLASPP